MRAGEETAWSLRAEIRTRVGSAALVLDGPATSTRIPETLHPLKPLTCMRAGEETAWSLRAEIRARVGSAALVLDGPGGERVLRAGLEGLAATTKLYPKTLAVRIPAFPCSHRTATLAYHLIQFADGFCWAVRVANTMPMWLLVLHRVLLTCQSPIARFMHARLLDMHPQVRAAVAAMGVVAPEGTLVRTGGRLHPSPSFAVAPSEAEPEERGDEDGAGADGADASAGDGAIAVAQLHSQVRLPGTPRPPPTHGR